MLTILISGESLLLLLLSVLMVGLLRSHAEILRWQTSYDEEHEHIDAAKAVQEGSVSLPATARSLSGLDLKTLEPLSIDLAQCESYVVMAFLSSGCIACEDFWAIFRGGNYELPLPGGGEVVIVGKDREHDSISRLRKLAPKHIPVVLSSDAWREYAANTSPYFVCIAPDGHVVGAGVSRTWEQLTSTLESAIEDVAINDAIDAQEASVERSGHPDAKPAAA